MHTRLQSVLLFLQVVLAMDYCHRQGLTGLPIQHILLQVGNPAALLPLLLCSASHVSCVPAQSTHKDCVLGLSHDLHPSHALCVVEERNDAACTFAGFSVSITTTT